MNAVIGDPDMDTLLNDSNAAPSITGDDDMDALIRDANKPKIIYPLGDGDVIDETGRSPVGEVVRQAISGTSHSIVGGYRGLGKLLMTGGDVNAATDAINDETGKAYVAPDSTAKSIASSKWNPLNWIQSGANELADLSQEPIQTRAGTAVGAPPAVGAMIKAAPTAVGGVLGLRSFMARDPAIAAPLTAQDVVDRAVNVDRQSMGAASSTVDISAASPALKAAIEATDPSKLDRQAMLNHLEAERHGLVGDAALTKGQAARDPIQFSEEQNRTNDPRIADRLSKQNTAMVEDFDRIRREASPSHVHEPTYVLGQNVVDALKAYDEPIKTDISAKYQALADANGGKFPIGGKTLNENIDAALAENGREGMVPSDIQRQLDKYRDGSKQMTFNDFERLRSDAADAMRSAANGRERNAASIVREQLEALPLLPKAAGLKNLADEARAAAKARFDALDMDPAYKAAVDDVSNGVKRGDPSGLADKFLDKYALNASKANLDRMMTKLNDDAKEAIATHTLNSIRSQAVGKTGIITPASFNGALNYQTKLESLLKPKTIDDLKEAANVVSNAKATPPGSSIAPKSGVIVRAALEAGAEHALNVATSGKYGIAKKLGFKLPGTTDKFVRDALKPGAGIERQ